MPDVSAERCRAAIARHVPDLRMERVEPLSHHGWGGDSDAWLVNGELVFRFPRTPAIAAQLAVEACLLPQLAPTLPLAIPNFMYIARGAATGAPLFVGYRAIAGAPMTPALLAGHSLTDAQARALAATMGSFLTALHSFPVAQARACGATTQSEPEHTRALLERVREHVYPLFPPPLHAWTDHLFGDALASPLLWEYTPALVHGDLGSDHILFDPTRRAIAGIIDFGDMAIGDPLGDFVGLAAYDATFLEAALAAYTRPLGGAATERLAFYQKRLPFIALAWGAAHADQEALDNGMALLRAVVARG
jgi:aminoglycoside 2''-phosphotransferase